MDAKDVGLLTDTSQPKTTGKARSTISRKPFWTASSNGAQRRLLASCERHAVDPQRCLTSVFAKLGLLPRDAAGHIPTAELEPFLPDVWKKEDAAEPLAPTPESPANHRDL
jgi:hypothetical protein